MLNETVGNRWYKILELNATIALPSIISTTSIANNSIWLETRNQTFVQ